MKTYLRPWNLDDVPALVRYANNPKISARLTDAFPSPYTEEDAVRFITMAQSADPIRLFAICNDQEAIGGIGLHPQEDIYRNNAELGYWLGEPFWGKGIMTSCVREIVAYGFEKLPITRIFARPFGSNKGSQQVLIKAGFHLEAHIPQILIKNGQLEDEMVFAVRR